MDTVNSKQNLPSTTNPQNFSEEIVPHDLDTIGGLVSVLVFISLAGLLYNHNGLLTEFLLNIDVTKLKLLSSKDCSRLVMWFQENLQFWTEQPINKNIQWTDDRQSLCELVNSVVPGACTNAHDRGHNPHSHGQELALKYFDIPPIFSNDELNNTTITSKQSKKLKKYIKDIQEIVTKIKGPSGEMYSNNYIAKGMGLVAGQQHRKAKFHIYPNPKQFEPSNILVHIKGPNDSTGHVVVPAIHKDPQICQKPTNYQRAFYMSLKLNSISPTVHGTSFLRRLSIDLDETKNDFDIPIEVKLSESQAKVFFVPNQSGIHEVSLTTNGTHLIGSPFTVTVEPSTDASNCSSESLSDDDLETIGKKKKVISRVVDFIDEKMTLNKDGTLVKLRAQNCDNASTKIDKPDGLMLNDNMISNVEYNEELISDENMNNQIIKNDPTLEKTNFETRDHRHETIEYVCADKNKKKMSENADLIHCKSAINNDINSSDVRTTSSHNENVQSDSTSSIYDFSEKVYISQTSFELIENGSSEIINIDITKVISINTTEINNANNVPKTFSKSDSTYEQLNNNYFISDAKLDITPPHVQMETQKNDPDLISCHTENTYKLSFRQNRFDEIYEKLRIYCGYLNDFDIEQMYLKSLLIDEIKTNKIYKISNDINLSTHNTIFPGQDINNLNIPQNKNNSLVAKQKEFWERKIINENTRNKKNHLKKININQFKNSLDRTDCNSSNTSNHTDNFITDKSDDVDSKSNFSLHGIVNKKKEIFESKIRTNRLIKKSQSLEICSVKKSNDISGISLQSIDICNFPSIDEKKSQFLSHSTLHKYDKKCLHHSSVNFLNSKTSTNTEKEETNSSSEFISRETKKRIDRYNKAKLHFEMLVESSPNEMFHTTKNKSVVRSKSVPCLNKVDDSGKKIGGSLRSKMLSDRFYVNNLFSDILGDSENYFRGIPNKTAVVASLASLNKADSQAPIATRNALVEPIRPKRKKDKNLQNFYHEYPYIPTTHLSNFKPRTSPEVTGLIPRRILISKSMNEIYI